MLVKLTRIVRKLVLLDSCNDYHPDSNFVSSNQTKIRPLIWDEDNASVFGVKVVACAFGPKMRSSMCI